MLISRSATTIQQSDNGDAAPQQPDSSSAAQAAIERATLRSPIRRRLIPLDFTFEMRKKVKVPEISEADEATFEVNQTVDEKNGRKNPKKPNQISFGNGMKCNKIAYEDVLSPAKFVSIMSIGMELPAPKVYVAIPVAVSPLPVIPRTTTGT
ncbi:hypothetical protein G5I_07781 [Acromyrmex echinatior]|uniref:Uncharacterized protein n=1 Tax=Acromyrmex echinatior TaxID=103372 RepID=F4WPQ5_ACREC|nr:hypothetical protein G5I_07781 [Acromyrmex echinatior]